MPPCRGVEKGAAAPYARGRAFQQIHHDVLDAGAVEPQLVITAAAVDDVVATAADESVIAVASPDGVREIGAANLEIAVVEGEGIAVAPAVVSRYSISEIEVDPSRSMLIVDTDG